jgi:hypothetical protein
MHVLIIPSANIHMGKALQQEKIHTLPFAPALRKLREPIF